MLDRVNYLGHVAMALATGRDEPSFVLGAALPDLATMAGVRFDRSLLPAAVADGVVCHLVADTAFHAHPVFRSGAALLRADLRASGLATGPTRAIGHAGWELLLDGTLVGGPAEGAYREALASAGGVASALAPEHRARWLRLVARGAPASLRYDDPAWVTDRLLAMLARRPRLAVDLALAPLVTEVLAGHAPAVRVAALALLAEVATAVA